MNTPTAKNNHTLRRTLPYVAVFALIAAIVYGLWPQPLQVEIVRVGIGALRTTISEEGKTRIKQRYLVSSPASGQLRRIALKAGDAVEGGRTLLAVVDPIAPTLLDARGRATASARRDAAAANVEKARAAEVFAEADVRRFEKLFAAKMIPLREIETARLNAASTAKEKTAAEGALRQAEAELADFTQGAAKSGRALTEIYAPVSGRVLRVIEESARVVGAGSPLLEIGDPAELEAIISVLSRDGTVIKPGTAVELEQWGGGKPLPARVRFVEPAAFTKFSALGVEEQRVNVVVDIEASAAERLSLGDNFRVEGRIITWQTERTLKAPTGALFRRGNAWFAFVLDGGHARLAPVTVGVGSATEMQILGGLKEGDEVVVYPGDRVQDGMRVKAIKVSAL